MQSFRTELENPLVEKDIIDLEKKIRMFREGEIHEEKFRSLRLARGVYGQRQKGVQMVRIKLPYGRISFKQWKRISDISDEYSTGNLHLTTRQDIQIHFVSLDRTPELWAKLEEDNITLREACGNTVRNITASVTSGIDPQEIFDVTPYADALFKYLLRNPVCQEMGRKIKIAFSNSDEDTALTYMHDLGFIPRIKTENGIEKRGFKVVLGGGLGAQPLLAQLAFEFLDEDLIIPYTEAVLRVFDRHGERNSRHKARLKFLIQKIGFDSFIELVNAEWKAIKVKNFSIEHPPLNNYKPEDFLTASTDKNLETDSRFQNWFKTNVFEQTQKGFYGVYIRIPLGNISSEVSRIISDQLENYIADDIRVTINQGLFLRFVKTENLPYVFSVLDQYHLAEPGANSVANITTCPGTDTCNLAISDSTNITYVLEDVIDNEYSDLIHNNDIKIKISGCMNSCGQHGMANIGFHGSSLKANGKVLPALQVLLGGGTLGSGEGRIADKVLKVPSKRGPDVLRVVLSDYETQMLEGEYFNDYYDRFGEKYFYTLLKPLADLSTLQNSDFVDWGQTEAYETEIGVGECAGVMIDLVATLLYESEEKAEWTKEAYEEGRFADSIYHAYSVFVSSAKALLLDKNVNCSTQHGVIAEFDKNFVETEIISLDSDFKSKVMVINQNEPSQVFAQHYIQQAFEFLEKAKAYKNERVVTLKELV